MINLSPFAGSSQSLRGKGATLVAVAREHVSEKLAWHVYRTIRNVPLGGATGSSQTESMEM